ncbi:MAG: phosphoribosylformylglycinamidine synthase subunit PurS [Acidimicrobiales bacterium]
MRYEVMVEVRLRPGIADPAGATIERALPALGFSGIEAMSVGKSFRFTVDAGSEDEAGARAEDLAIKLLGNPVIEDAFVTVEVPESPAS